MKKISLLLSILALTLCASGQSQVTLVVDAGASKHQISRHIYGHFSEHLGRCIYDGYWVDPAMQVPKQDRIRLDIVDALKKIKIPNLRWPGGCFADEYHWRDGIGPREQRPTMINTNWGNVTEDNSFGTHEFLLLCELLDTEPFIIGNVGSGTVEEMSRWIEYLNFDGVSPMTNLRKENGRDEPWRVTYWGVGNENWGCGGNMTPEYYVTQYRQYSSFAKNYPGAPLRKIACGASGANYQWTEVLMQGLAAGGGRGAMWGIWTDPEPGTNPRFLYQQNSLRDAIIAGSTLNIFNNHCDRVRMAQLAQTINVLQALVLTEGPKMILTPTYHVFDMFKAHHDAMMLPVKFTSPDYVIGDQRLPALNVSASKDSLGVVHMTLVNIDPNNPVNLSATLDQVKWSSVKGQILTSARITDINTFDNPSNVRITGYDGAGKKGNLLTAVIPAKSIVLLEIK